MGSATVSVRCHDHPTPAEIQPFVDLLQKETQDPCAIPLQALLSSIMAAHQKTLSNPTHRMGGFTLWVCVDAEGGTQALMLRRTSDCFFWATDPNLIVPVVEKAFSPSERLSLWAIHRPIKNAILEHYKSRSNSLPCLWDTPCGLFTCERVSNDLLDAVPEVPGLNLRPLSLSHADLVVSTWPYGTRFLDPLTLIQYMISSLPTLAAYINNEPVSWMLTYPYGAIGIAYTCPEYRNKGMAKHIAARLAALRIDQCGIATTYVGDNNHASMAMMGKVGFQRVADADWCGLGIPEITLSNE